MNSTQSGYCRDNNILLAIEEWGLMDAKMVKVMFYEQFKWGLRMAQDKLMKLTEKKGKLKRWRYQEGYCYCLKEREKPGRAEHLLALNWVRLWFNKNLHSWEKLHCFKYEDKYDKILLADAFVAKKNKLTGELKCYFVELDRSDNRFNKVKLYNKLFQELRAGRVQRWWAELTKGFPEVLIVTTTQARKDVIQEIIDRENLEYPGMPEGKGKLSFKVRLLSEIREELSCLKR